MKHRRELAIGAAAVAGLYLLLAAIVFDFTSMAHPYDEENFGGQTVAIGPKPRSWIPGATRSIDIPGGADYDESAWPFVVWKPLCVVYVKARGHALPSGWR